MQTTIYASREVSLLECLSGGLGSISDPRCVIRWRCVLTFFLNLVQGSRLMHCHKIYSSPVTGSSDQGSCLPFYNKVEYSHHRELTWLCAKEIIILQSILSRLTLQGMSAGNPWWKGRSPKDHPPHGSSSGSSFLVKRTRKGQVLQQEPIGKAWRGFYSLSWFCSLMMASLVCFQISEGR